VSTSHEIAVVLRGHCRPRCIPASCSLLCASPTLTTISTSLEVATWRREFGHDGSRATHSCCNGTTPPYGGRTRCAGGGGQSRCILRSLYLPAQVSHGLIAPGCRIPFRLARTRNEVILSEYCPPLVTVRCAVWRPPSPRLLVVVGRVPAPSILSLRRALRQQAPRAPPRLASDNAGCPQAPQQGIVEHPRWRTVPCRCCSCSPSAVRWAPTRSAT